MFISNWRKERAERKALVREVRMMRVRYMHSVGYSNIEIAHRLNTKESTVRFLLGQT